MMSKTNISKEMISIESTVDEICTKNNYSEEEFFEMMKLFKACIPLTPIERELIGRKRQDDLNQKIISFSPVYRNAI